MRPLVFLFGGQSSRDPRMVDRLCAVDSQVGADVRSQIGTLDLTTNAGIQLGVHATTIGWWNAVSALGFKSTTSAGLSLGEYAHVVDIGAVDPGACVDLVKRRGQLYDDGPAGCMAAIYPCEAAELLVLIPKGADVAVAVYNSPTQTVVGGKRPAVEALMDAADQELFCLSTMIEEHIPMHTHWFKDVAPSLQQALEATPFVDAEKPYWPNVVGEPCQATPDAIRRSLFAHVFEPVRWRQTIDAMVKCYPDAVFLEVGPRTVLSDLMKRRWHNEQDIFCVDNIDGDPREHFLRTMDEVAHALG